jgi:hypothetical protein
LLEVHEEHLAICSMHVKGKQPLNMVGEWKNLEKKNIALAALVRRFPAFTRIYKENLMLREQERSTVYLDPIRNEEKEKTAITYSTE